MHNILKLTREIDHSAIGKQLNNHSHLIDTLHKHAGAIASGAGKAASGLVGIATSAFNVFLLGFSVLFMTLFLVKDLPSYRAALSSLQGNADRDGPTVLTLRFQPYWLMCPREPASTLA